MAVSRMTPAPRYICTNCLRTIQRRSFSTPASEYASAAASASSLPPAPPLSGVTKLTTRRLITLYGLDASKFLQGLITNDVTKRDPQGGYFAAFLNAQGKVLNDTFVYPINGALWERVPEDLRGDKEEPGYLLEVDATTIDQLLQVFKRHKLRSKLKFRAVEDGQLDVWSAWNEGDRWTAHGQQPPKFGEQGVLSVQDSRAPGLGHRLLLPAADAESALEGLDQAPLSAYTIRRYLRGVPEGDREIPRTESLPMNYNMDLMGGIDFKKGCYSGQELTIRTHHTGVVRRRILPIVLYEKDMPAPTKLEYDPNSNIPGSELARSDIRRMDKLKRSSGEVIAGVGNIGLGMCRVEQMSDLVVSGEGSTFSPEHNFLVSGVLKEKYGVTAFVPDWIRGQIRAPKVQKRVE